MSLSKPVRRIAIVGTGVICASWDRLLSLPRFDMVATDLAPNAEGRSSPITGRSAAEASSSRRLFAADRLAV